MVKKRQRNSFLTPLVVEVQPDGRTFKIYREFTYRWYWREKGVDLVSVVRVPLGFVTDFASIPRIARLIIPKLGKHTKASVVHDYLYSGHRFLSRAKADQCFRAGMKELGVSWAKRWAMWAAVRLGGWMAWGKG